MSLASEQQNAPIPAEGDVWLEVIKDVENLIFGLSPGIVRLLFARLSDDIEERRQFGLQKYKVPVQIGNGRNFRLDAYQELLDSLVYLKGDILSTNNEASIRCYHTILSLCLLLRSSLLDTEISNEKSQVQKGS